MPDDNILKIGAEFDVGPIIAAEQKTVQSFDNMAAGVQKSFATVGQADAAVAKQVEASTNQVVGGFVGLKDNGILAYDALRGRLIEATAEVGRLRSEILNTNDQAKLTVLHEELARATKEMMAARSEMRALGMETTETAEKMRLFGESVGVRVPTEMSKLLGRLPMVQQAMAAAFEVGIVVFFISMLGEAVEKLGEFTEELGGFTKEVKAEYKEALEGNQRLINQTIELAKRLDDVNLVGKEGAAKYAQEQVNVERNSQRIANEAGRLLRELQGTQKTIEELETKKTWVYGPFSGLAGINTELEQAQERLKTVQKELNEREKEMRDEPAKAKGADAEEVERKRTEMLKIRLANVEAEKSYELALTNFEEAEYRRREKIGEVTLEQETSLLLDAETRRLAIEEEAYKKRRALKEAESVTAKGEAARNVQADIVALDEKMNEERVKSNQRRIDLISSADELEIKRDLSNAEARINAAHMISEAEIKLQEDRARRVFATGDTPAELEAAAIPYIKATTAAYDDQIAKIRERADAMVATVKDEEKRPTAALGTNAFAEQLRAIEKTKPELFRQLLEINAEAQRLAQQQADAVEKIEQEKTEKIKNIRRREAEDQVSEIREGMATIEGLYQDDIAHLQDLYTRKELTLREYTDAAKMFAREEYQARIETLERERQAVDLERLAELITEADYVKKLNAIDQQEIRYKEQLEHQLTEFTKQEDQKREEQLKQTTQKMGAEFASAVDRMITHQQTFSRSISEMASQIELNLINRGIERVVQHYGEQFLKLLATHTQFITQFIASHSTFLATLLGIETAGDAQKLAKKIASNTAEITSDAGLSYAAGFASVMEALPFPANIATAPGVAAAAAAQTEVGALAFDFGGIVPGREGEPVPAVVHGGESVFTDKATEVFRMAVPSIQKFNSTFEGGRQALTNNFGGDTHHYQTMHNNIRLNVEGGRDGGVDHEAIMHAVRKGFRSGSSYFFRR